MILKRLLIKNDKNWLKNGKNKFNRLKDKYQQLQSKFKKNSKKSLMIMNSVYNRKKQF